MASQPGRGSQGRRVGSAADVGRFPSMQLFPVGEGKLFRHILRPLGASQAPPFRVRFELMDVLTTERGHQVGRHQHAHYEFLIVDAGRYAATINDVDIVAKPGSIVMLKPGDFHADTCLDAMTLRVIRLRIDPGPQPDQSYNIFSEQLAPIAQIFEDRDQFLSSLVARIEDEAVGNTRFAAEMLDLLASEFIWGLLRRLPSERLAPAISSSLAERGFAADLQRVFECHLDESLGLRELAEHMELSERTLTARCRALLGESPTRLFVKHKMSNARNLLMQTDIPIKEISAHFGFENPYHFSTVYKRVYGVSPTAHR